jgi:MFS family permease
MSAGNFISIVLQYIDNAVAYFIIAIVIRIFMGIGEGMFMTCVYSVLPILYAETVESKIAMLEAVTGAGLSLGPFIGGLLYRYGSEQLKFTLPFVFTGALTLVPVPMLWQCFRE